MRRDVVIGDTTISKFPAEVYIHDTGPRGPMEGGFVELVLLLRVYQRSLMEYGLKKIPLSQAFLSNGKKGELDCVQIDLHVWHCQ